MLHSFEDLIGKTIISITGKKGDAEIIFETSDHKKFKLFHKRECCETVFVQDIIGNISDLVGCPLLMAEEESNPPDPEGWTPYEDDFQNIQTFYRWIYKKFFVDHQEDSHHLWTFYKLATAKGYVTIRWYGGAIGNYSERVDFEQISPLSTTHD